MQVVELWRYPVKSMQGERLDEAVVDGLGLVGDRRFALTDRDTGVGLTARRHADLLLASARYDDAGLLRVTLPDGTVTLDDDRLSDWIGLPVRLESASPDRTHTYENLSDPEDDASRPVPWEGPAGTFHDSGRTQVSLVATGDLRDWPARRFRPNVVVEGDTADHLVGRRVVLGGVQLQVVKRIDRCVMIIRPQPGGIERDVDVLRTIRAERDFCMGVGALVERPGTISLGDELEVL